MPAPEIIIQLYNNLPLKNPVLTEGSVLLCTSDESAHAVVRLVDSRSSAKCSDRSLDSIFMANDHRKFICGLAEHSERFRGQ